MLHKVEAIIRASKLYDVKDALHNVGVDFFSYSEVSGVGMQKQEAVYRGEVYDMGTIDRIKLEILISENLETVMKTIQDAAQTGELGDGRIFVSTVDTILNIRTSEKDAAALTIKK